ncbi:MAG: lipopolysaccharide biosynthesis protein [Bacteroidaceae bacterium]|nr:lipopolysaccharide biosynthesis protein [Bacteroidaceae bacterium]
MEINKSLVIKSLFWKFFERLGTQLVSFAVTILIARKLLPEQYGTVALVTIFINICNVIIDGGFNTALIQKKNVDNKDFSTILYFSLAVAVVLYIILFTFAPHIALFFNDPILTDVIRVLSLNLVFYAINSIQRAYVSKYMLFNKLFYSSFIAVIISGLIGVVMAYKGFGVWSLVAQNVSNIVVTSAVMCCTINWKPILTFSLERFKTLFSYGWKIFMANFITVIFLEIRKLLIGKKYSRSDLAYYEKGDQIPGLIMGNIFTSIQSILLPTFSEYQDDKLKVKTMMRRSTKMSCFVIYPMMVGMIVLAEPMIQILLGDKWLGVVPFIQILCVANFFRPITISNWEAIKALGYSEITLKLEVLKKVIDVLILLVSIRMGVEAIAWGVVTYNFICIFINLAPNVKLLDYKIREQILDATPTLIISLVMGIAVYFAGNINLGIYLLTTIQILVGILTYTLLCAVLKEDSFCYLLETIRKKR